MSTDAQAPRPGPDVVDDGIPATEEVPESWRQAGEVPEGDMPMPDRPWGATAWGTTAAEEAVPEPVALRADHELPDVLTEEEAPAGRLYEPGVDEGDGSWIDGEADVIGELDGSNDDTLSAEEAAVHIVEEPGGLSYSDSPGYLDED